MKTFLPRNGAATASFPSAYQAVRRRQIQGSAPIIFYREANRPPSNREHADRRCGNGQDIGVGAAGFFEGVGEDGHIGRSFRFCKW